MRPGSREVRASGPLKEVTVTGPKIAAVERREARVPVKRRAAPQGADEERSAVSALRSPRYAREKGKEGASPAPAVQGAAGARPNGRRRDARIGERCDTVLRALCARAV